jgi:hypothetical protein
MAFTAGNTRFGPMVRAYIVCVKTWGTDVGNLAAIADEELC